MLQQRIPQQIPPLPVVPHLLSETPLQLEADLLVHTACPLVERDSAKINPMRTRKPKRPIEPPVDGLGAVALVLILGRNEDLEVHVAVLVQVPELVTLTVVERDHSNHSRPTVHVVLILAISMLSSLTGTGSAISMASKTDIRSERGLAYRREDLVAVAPVLWSLDQAAAVGVADGVFLDLVVEFLVGVGVLDTSVYETLRPEGVHEVQGFGFGSVDRHGC